jgi:hypothetical protein
LLAAQIAEKVVNWGFRAPKEPAKITDFMPSRWQADSQAAPIAAGKPKRLTAWHRREIANGWRRFLGSGFDGYTTVQSGG